LPASTPTAVVTAGAISRHSSSSAASSAVLRLSVRPTSRLFCSGDSRVRLTGGSIDRPRASTWR
jgi:hypothetical protein